MRETLDGDMAVSASAGTEPNASAVRPPKTTRTAYGKKLLITAMWTPNATIEPSTYQN